MLTYYRPWKGTYYLYLGLILSFFTQPAWCLENEYTIKAAFVAKLVRFIDWPPAPQAEKKRKKLALCVIGDNPFGEQLEQLEQLTANQEKPFQTTAIQGVAEIPACDLLFIARSKRRQLVNILDRTKGERPILTFGDTPGYAERGVMINFYVEAGRVGFEINRKAAEASGFDISSRILKLARIVDQ